MNYVRRMFGKEKPLVRVLPLIGTIKAGRGKQNLNITNLEKLIAQTFDCKKVRPKAVVLDINSNGGSAVQSNLIYKRIRNMAENTNLPVISHVQDAAVSGGYWLALAGDEIYSDPNSAIGSIGVVSLQFGLEEVFKKLGFEPRILKAGKHKLRINPFEAQKPEDAVWMTNFMAEIHENFKNLVKERRTSLQVDHETVFEADVFTGQSAVKVGLIDGTTSDIDAFIKKRYGDDIQVKRMETKSKFPFGLDRFGAELKLDTRAMLDSFSDAQSRLKTF